MHSLKPMHQGDAKMTPTAYLPHKFSVSRQTRLQTSSASSPKLPF